MDRARRVVAALAPAGARLNSSWGRLFSFGGSAAPAPPAAPPATTVTTSVTTSFTPFAAAPATAVVAAAAVRRAPAAKPKAAPKKKRVLRAPSAYNLYIADAAKGVASVEQGAAAFKAAAARWKTMGVAEKARWQAAAAAEKAKFVAAHPPAPRAPLRPPSAYTLFVKERLPRVPSSVPPRERMSRVAAEWRAMTAAGKAPYLARAAAGGR